MPWQEPLIHLSVAPLMEWTHLPCYRRTFPNLRWPILCLKALYSPTTTGRVTHFGVTACWQGPSTISCSNMKVKVSSFPLTNSIIFQRGKSTTNQKLCQAVTATVATVEVASVTNVVSGHPEGDPWWSWGHKKYLLIRYNIYIYND